MSKYSLQVQMGLMPDVSMRPRGMVFGGGGGGVETVSTIPQEFIPPLKESIEAASAGYKAGDYGKVAGLTDQQQQGFGDILGATAGQADTALKSAAARDVLGGFAAGAGGLNTQGLRDKAVHDAKAAFAPTASQFAQTGNIGGGRQALAQGEASSQLARALADIDYREQDRVQSQQIGAAQQVIGAGQDIQGQYVTPGQTRAEVGSALQEQSQREADAAYQAVQRLGGVLTGTPIPQQQAVQKGGK